MFTKGAAGRRREPPVFKRTERRAGRRGRRDASRPSECSPPRWRNNPLSRDLWRTAPPLRTATSHIRVLWLAPPNKYEEAKLPPPPRAFPPAPLSFRSFSLARRRVHRHHFLLLGAINGRQRGGEQLPLWPKRRSGSGGLLRRSLASVCVLFGLFRV